MISLLLFLIGLGMAVAGARWLVNGGTSLARLWGVSDMTIGLTVVAFGTSLPELVVNVVASIDGSDSLVIGNILGSNTANILLILGLSAIICPLTATSRSVRGEMPLCVLAGFLPIVLLWDMLVEIPGRLGRVDAVILLAVFAGFLGYVARHSRAVDTDTADGDEAATAPAAGAAAQPGSKAGATLRIVAGIVFLTLGGRSLVTGAEELASAWGLSESFVGLTLVAFGTSTPELATSVFAAARRNTDIAIGNILGSNIFNVFFILSVSQLIRPITVSVAALVEFGVATVAALLLVAAMYTGRRYIIERWEGLVFLLSYIAYVGYLWHRG